MELKVWVEGIQRIVCGVTEETTCQDVVYALACATGRTGRFTLTERWRNNERLLGPNEYPLKVLLKWGEYSNDVQFILQYSGSVGASQTQNSVKSVTTSQSQNTIGGSAAISQSPSAAPQISLNPAKSPLTAERNRETRKSLTFSSQRRSENIGIVKGIPKKNNLSTNATVDRQLEIFTSDDTMSASSQSPKACGQTPIKSFADGSHSQPNSVGSRLPPSYRDSSDPSITHVVRSLPPYRDPPPVVPVHSRISPLSAREPPHINMNIAPKRNIFKNELSGNASVMYSSQYRDLVRLINFQRDKLSAQQVELTKYDAEIVYWEAKTKEQQHQMDMLAKDASRVDNAMRQIEDQLKSLGKVEEEAEIVNQQDRTLRSELTLLRSKLSNCETELLLCKNKIRLLMDEIQVEQRILSRETEERNHIERSMVAEVDRLQKQVDQAKHDAEMATHIGDTLRKEVALLEATISEKKRQVEKLVADMKEANLQSLAISPPEELKLILEGPHKPGSTRRMIGSPRQLENAVPTSKNPHGTLNNIYIKLSSGSVMKLSKEIENKKNSRFQIISSRLGETSKYMTPRKIKKLPDCRDVQKQYLKYKCGSVTAIRNRYLKCMRTLSEKVQQCSANKLNSQINSQINHCEQISENHTKREQKNISTMSNSNNGLVNDKEKELSNYEIILHIAKLIKSRPIRDLNKNAKSSLFGIQKRRMKRPTIYNRRWVRSKVKEYFDPEDPNVELVTDVVLKMLLSKDPDKKIVENLLNMLGTKYEKFILVVLKHRSDVVIRCNKSIPVLNESYKLFSKLPEEIKSKVLMKKKKKVEVDEYVEIGKYIDSLFNKSFKPKKKKIEKVSKRKFKFKPLTVVEPVHKEIKKLIVDQGIGQIVTVRDKEVYYPHVYDYRVQSKATTGYVGSTRLFLPEESKRFDYKTYEEVNIPRFRMSELTIGTPFIPISELDEIGQKAFEGMETLNRIQSIVFETAYFTNENLLICAPTGAGKTNIALLAMLREIKNNMEDKVIKKTEFKIIYVAPMKALAAEMTDSFAKRLKPLDIVVREFTGDAHLSKEEINASQVIVTTPEKYDVLTRKTDVDFKLISLVRAIIIDEVHLLHSDRGHVIEAIVARTLRMVESTQKMIRIVALSATLPNYIDVAQFLRVNPEKGLFYFDARFKPVPQHQCFIGVKPKGPRLHEVMDELAYDKVLSKIKCNHQAMVFVHTRNSTVKTARAFRNMAQSRGDLGFFCPPNESSRQLGNPFRSAKAKELLELYSYGMSVHHAGLVRSDRSLVEKNFRNGLVKVLMCTSTLAWGVNLPAHAVIIKGTDMYDTTQGKYVDIGILDVLQIFGRAGRPQYDSSGYCVIITPHHKLSHYLSLLKDQLPIESQFISKLADNLNAEIALNNVTTVAEGIEWLSYTYLYVRMRQNPMEYGISYTELSEDYDLVQKRESLIIQAAEKLDECQMIRFNSQTGDFSITDIGRAACVNYIRSNTIFMFNDNIQPGIDMADILYIVSMAEEFKQIKPRQDELQELDELLEYCVHPVKGGSENDYGKVNILLQTYISRLAVKSFSLECDLLYINQNVGRLVRALFEICLRKQRALATGRFLKFSQMLEHVQWDFESEFRQFYIIPPDIIGKIENRSLNIPTIREMDSKEIGRMLRFERMGNTVKQCAMEFPYLTIGSNVKPVTSKVIKIHLRYMANFKWNDAVHGKYREFFWIWIEDTKSNNIYHWENLYITKAQVLKSEIIDLIAIIPIYEGMRLQLVVRATFDRWLGSETIHPLTIDDLILPIEKEIITNLLPITPLPVSVIGNKRYEKLYKFTHFNNIQGHVFHCVYHTDKNVLLGAPTGSGKTVVAELAFFRVFKHYPNGKIVYIAPLKALVKERVDDWTNRLGKKLKKNVIELTGDVTPDMRAISNAHVIVTTPEKWDGISRSWRTRNYVRQVVLIVIDEIHMLGEDRGPILEVIVSRTNYVAQHTQHKPRIIGLSTAISNASDLADWLGIQQDDGGLYNFRPSVRPVPLEVHMKSFPGKHYCPRMATMNKPIYRAIKQYSPNKPVLVFVSSRRQTRLTALDLITYLSEEGNPKQWLQMKEHKCQQVLMSVTDANLRFSLPFGIGIHHAGLIESDRKIVEQLFLNQNIRVLMTTATLAWGINLPAHLVIVKGTEYFDGKLRRFVDMPVTDVLQMMGRAGRPQFDDTATAIIMVHDVKKNHYKRFLYEPFPVESNLLEVFPEHLNAEIVADNIRYAQDVFTYILWTYFYRRLIANPLNYYLPTTDANETSDFLAMIIDNALNTLHDAGCLLVNEDGRLHSTALGKIASFYYLSYQTMKHLDNLLRNDLTIEQLLSIFCHVHEYSEIPVRHNENLMNLKLSEMCPIKVDHSTLDSAHTKTFLMFQAHFSRLMLPCEDYYTDFKSVLDQALRIIQAIIDVCGDRGWLRATINTQLLMQMIIQARWYYSSAFLTLPHMDQNNLSVLLNLAPTLPSLSHKISELTLPLWIGLRNTKMFTKSQVKEIIKYCEQLPKVKISIRICEPELNEDGSELLGESVKESREICITVGKMYTINVFLQNRNPSTPKIIQAPKFPKPKENSWFLTLGNNHNEELLYMRRVTLFGCVETKVVFNYTPQISGNVHLTLFLISDSLMGMDQQRTIKFSVIE